VQGAVPVFMLTENELGTAEARDRWVLAIVTSALSGEPNLYLVPAQDLDRYFARSLENLCFRLTGTPMHGPSNSTHGYPPYNGCDAT
jgi:hypothetical protein